jgi:hypothetical protein
MKRDASDERVMVLSAAAGAGHVRSAEALVAGFGAQGIPASHVEVLKYTNPLLKRLYVELVNRQPQLLGYLYHALDRPWHLENGDSSSTGSTHAPSSSFSRKRTCAWPSVPISFRRRSRSIYVSGSSWTSR